MSLQSPLPFYYVQITKAATVTTSALSAAPLVIGSVVSIPVNILASTVSNAWLEGIGLTYDYKLSVGVEIGTVDLQNSLDGGTTFSSISASTRGSGSSAAFATITKLQTPIQILPVATPLQFRIAAYVNVGAETLSVKNLSAKFILNLSD